ncbi:MAG: nucleotidyl transferase AbiEii/AbiGii toxin family protein [Dysgonamonadaceae bacterium]|jgi:predicted nucleotidyltransferase component of viral defense system|nr:nucleotidyl transferase AbiEii/AbiGii toxin family protein [Dysgonamonadaceae bacterium]
MSKNYAKSKKAKLLHIAQQEQLQYQMLITRYLFERLLYRLSASKYKEKFCLKGGTLLYALVKETPRPTLDIDFLGLDFSNEMDNIKNAFIEILSIECEEDGVIFDAKSIVTTELIGNKRYAGIRVSYIAHLDSVRQQMQIDIGFGDIITPAPQNLSYPVFFDELPAPEVYAYSLETVIAEKFHTMIELGNDNSRFKDFYDTYKILTTRKIDDNTLIDAILATFQNRKTIFQENHPLFSEEFIRNPNRQLHWNSFLRKIKSGSIDFETVVKYITARLQPIYEQLLILN